MNYELTQSQIVEVKFGDNPLWVPSFSVLISIGGKALQTNFSDNSTTPEKKTCYKDLLDVSQV